MKILSTEQIYQTDQATILEKGINSVDLMETAANKCFEFIRNNYNIENQSLKIFCGVGNNGGDGLVIARLLQQINADLACYIVHFSDKRSEDFHINFERIKHLNIKIYDIFKENDFPEIQPNDLVIDAIFGLGLKKSPFGFTKELIKKLNNSNAYIISIDLPSGLLNGQTIIDSESVIKANKILTFQVPKLALLLPENKDYCLEFEILDIGLSQNYISSLTTNKFFTTPDEVQKLWIPRIKFSHKGSYGHSLLIGGSFGKIGAITLASKAALKVGSGLVSAYIPKCAYQIVQTSIPEVMVEVDNDSEIHHFNYKTIANVIGIGPGIGLHEKTMEGFINFLKLQKKPMVIDADALNILAQNKLSLKLIPKNSVLTPHPKEFERLAGSWKNDYEKLKKLRDFSLKYNVIVVLKGAFTVIAHQNNLYFNSTGNAALATAGSGDVLTGIITGLIAQGYTPFDASLIGVYIHGKTADIYCRQNPQETFLASDIIEFLPNAIKETFYS
ncbi:MAG: NAD(P)H-hydrate dehydratase [Flavobacteriaceae bacterium]|nr:NAD(P)H-hydrate dehydratase [Flavobacteriaceae bacterium]